MIARSLWLAALALPAALGFASPTPPTAAPGDAPTTATLAIAPDAAAEPARPDAADPSPDSPDTDPWEWQQVRARHIEAIEWTRALSDAPTTATLALVAEAATTGTLARRCAAVMAMRNAGVALPRPGADATLREAALFRPPAGATWGWQPLIEHAAGTVLNARPYPEHLLDQFGDDDLDKNATRAAELYHEGLLRDPRRFAGPLAARQRSLPLPTQDSWRTRQDRVLVNALLISLAFADPSKPVSLYAALDTRDPSHGPSLGALPPEVRSAVWSATAESAINRWRGDSPQTDWFLDRAYRLSWRLLERGGTAGLGALEKVIRDDRTSRHDRVQALAIWLLCSPTTLSEPENAALFADSMSEQHWRGSLIAEFLAAPRERLAVMYARATPGEEACSCSDCAGPATLFRTPIFRMPVAPADQIAAAADPLRRAIRRELASSVDPEAQLALSRFLIDAGWKDVAREEILAAVVSNFADDEVSDNNADATWLLSRMGEERADALRAAFRVGVDVNDWQMVATAAEALAAMDSSYRPAADARSIRMMAGHLADDQIEGNGIAARRYLMSCGPGALPELRAIEAESRDAQQRRYLRMVIDRLEALERNP